MGNGHVRVDEGYALQYQHVSRTFDHGKFAAVTDVSLDVQPGEIHSVIGPNGAGKTTLVKMAGTVRALNTALLGGPILFSAIGADFAITALWMVIGLSMVSIAVRRMRSGHTFSAI